MTQDRIDELLREIEELRNALNGRTVSCGQCNELAKQNDAVLRSRDQFIKQLHLKQDECRQLKQEVNRLDFAFSGEYRKSLHRHKFDGQNAVVYARCSTRQQSKNGDSIRRQLAVCLQFAMQNGIGIADVYCDAGMSGYKPHALKQRNVLLDKWGRVPDTQSQTLVLVESRDRWTRTPSVFDELVELVECSRDLWMQP